jgi:hypothetical protein
MAKKFPIVPAHPHRICWGCDRYCPADSLACGNGSERTPHPAELFGDDWQHWGLDAQPPAGSADAAAASSTATAVASGASSRNDAGRGPQ